ncbi:MAG: sigma-54-dependent Fis family transcriptional regulator, partial [Nitrospirae bacterium]
MKKPKILIVDDDRNLLELMVMRLEDAGFEPRGFDMEDGVVEEVSKNSYDLAILDLQLLKTDGITLMEEIHRVDPELPVVILTAHGSIESAVNAMQRGAYTYLTKPFDSRELIVQIERALKSRTLEEEVKRLKEMVRERYDFKNIIGKSQAMTILLQQMAQIATVDSSIFISGESGTGKELVARAIHMASSRKEKPFVEVNCAAIPENLFESELFGYEKGAFTGAVKKTRGYLAQADGGTLFLDEIGDMPLSVQAKLLRVLQEKRFQPLGSEQPVEVDFRLISATNKDLIHEVREGRFREDLFYRIHVIPLKIPPLRDRKDDIPLLVEHFICKFNEKMQKGVKKIAPRAMKKLLAHDWPGNVRELENVMEYAMAMCQGNTITDDLIIISRLPGVGILRPLKEERDAFERDYLTRLLRHTGGNVSKASEIAGKYRADFYSLLKKHNINPS